MNFGGLLIKPHFLSEADNFFKFYYIQLILYFFSKIFSGFKIVFRTLLGDDSQMEKLLLELKPGKAEANNNQARTTADKS